MAVPLFENTIVINSNQLIDWKDVGDGEDDTQYVFLGDEDWWNKHAYLLSLSDSDNRLNSEQREIIEDQLKKNQDALKVNLLNAIYTASENYKKNYKSSCLAWFGKGLWGHKHGGKDRLATCEKWIERKERNYDVDNKILLKDLIQEINADLEFSGETGGSLAARVSRILFPKQEKAEQTIFQKIGSFFSKSTFKTTLTELHLKLLAQSNNREPLLKEKKNITDCCVVRVKSLADLDWNSLNHGSYYVQTYTQNELGNKQHSNELHYFEGKQKQETLIFDESAPNLWGVISNSTNNEKNVTVNDLNNIILKSIKKTNGMLSSTDLSKITAWTKLKPTKSNENSHRHMHVSMEAVNSLKLLLESTPLFYNSKSDKGYLSKLWISLGFELNEMSDNPLKVMLEILQSLMILSTGTIDKRGITLPEKNKISHEEQMKDLIEKTFKALLNPSFGELEQEGIRLVDSNIKIAIYVEIEEVFQKKGKSVSSGHSDCTEEEYRKDKLGEIKEFYHVDNLEVGVRNELNMLNLKRLGQAVSEKHSQVSVLLQASALENNSSGYTVK